MLNDRFGVQVREGVPVRALTDITCCMFLSNTPIYYG